MFMGPLDASIAWSENGLDGARRFLDRIWRLFIDEATGELNSTITEEEGTEVLTRTYHQTVKKVSEDFEGLRFNVGISQLMVFINEAYKQEQLPKSFMEGFVKLVSPVAPHLAEELWQKLGHQGTLAYEAWPTYDEKYLVEDEIEIVVQVNGKVKAKLVIPKDANKEQMEELARADEKVGEAIEGKTVRKVIAVPGKLVNIVAN